MAEIITQIGLVLAMKIGTLGTTDITLGLLAAGGAVFGLAISVYQRVRR